MDLHVDDLNVSAKPLARVAIDVENMPEVPVPDAGVSGGPIANMLAALAGAAFTVASGAANAADLVQLSDANYNDADQANSQQLESRQDALDRAGLTSEFVGPVVQLPVNGAGR